MGYTKWFLIPSWESLGINAYYLTAIIVYMTTIQLLRYRRRDNLASKYGYRTRASYEKMTLKDSSAIMIDLATLEFPYLFSNSVAFAILKTYGIPSISKLLVATSQLVDPAVMTKRNIDTLQIMVEILLNHSSSPRHMAALTRMNYLHAGYRKADKISDADMLYVLSLFALEPVRWNGKYDWRLLSPLEKCALGTFWRYVTEAAEIPASVMDLDEEDARDGLSWLEALELWSVQYEATNMVYDEANVEVTDAFKDFLLAMVPSSLKPFGIGIISVIMGSRLRKAVGFPTPALLHEASFHLLIYTHYFTTLYLLPPRPTSLRTRWFTDPDPSTARINATQFSVHPWYIPSTLRARWSPSSLINRLGSGPLPGDSPKWLPEGYLIHELGPEIFKGKGRAEMDADAHRIREIQRKWNEGKGSGVGLSRADYVDEGYQSSVKMIYFNEQEKRGLDGVFRDPSKGGGGGGGGSEDRELGTWGANE